MADDARVRGRLQGLELGGRYAAKVTVGDVTMVGCMGAVGVRDAARNQAGARAHQKSWLHTVFA